MVVILQFATNLIREDIAVLTQNRIVLCAICTDFPTGANRSAGARVELCAVGTVFTTVFA